MAAIPVYLSKDKCRDSEQLLKIASELQVDANRFDSWKDSGFAGNLDYLKKRSGQDLINPKNILFPRESASAIQRPKTSGNDVISVLIFCVYYSRAQQPQLAPGFGRIARYAWGRDYHKSLGKRVKALAKELELRHLGISCRGFTDAIPLMERAFGRVAGLGFIGKNTLLIQPGEGSFSLLAGVAISSEVESFSSQARLSSCGSCSRCISQCPTGALVKPYTLDARRCISYLTIEKRGAFSDDESSMLGEWLFGCDICQEVCPFNERALKNNSRLIKLSAKGKSKNSIITTWKDFEPEAGVGPLINLADLLMIRSDEEFVKRFQGTPLMRAKREGLLRNAASVAANTRSYVVKEALEQAANCDTSLVVREQAARSLRLILGANCP